MLKKFETWGGEPFLRMDRIYPLIHQLIEEYPYFNSGYSSTNFSYPTWTDQFFGLMDCFGDYPYRDFHYCLQLSVDGPEYINDAGRGKGVTKRCLENFQKLTTLLS
jgi:sulfatase maturation enzyme AslB (radical SAM superfamily)